MICFESEKVSVGKLLGVICFFPGPSLQHLMCAHGQIWNSWRGWGKRYRENLFLHHSEQSKRKPYTEQGEMGATDIF